MKRAGARGPIGAGMDGGDPRNCDILHHMTVPGQSQPVPYGKTPESGHQSGQPNQSGQSNQQSWPDLSESTSTWRRPPPALGQYGIAGRYSTPPFTGRYGALSAVTGADGGSAPSAGGSAPSAGEASPYGSPARGPSDYTGPSAPVRGPSGYGSPASDYSPPGYGRPFDAAVARGSSAQGFSTQGSSARGRPSYGIVVNGAPTHGWPPHAPAQGPPATGSRPPRKRRTALVVSLVVAALVLSAGIGAAVLVLRGRGGGADDAYRWSRAWLNGFEETWTLGAPAERGDYTSVGFVGDDNLFRAVVDKDSTTVAAFALKKKGEPDLLWEEEFSGVRSGASVWQNRIVVGNTLIDVDSQDHTTAPWDADASVGVVGENAIVCVDTTCAMWTPSLKKKWEAVIPLDGQVVVWSSMVVDDHVLVNSSGGDKSVDQKYAVVDLATGDAKQVKSSNGVAWPLRLADGWLSYDGYSGSPMTISLYAADGTPRETFTSDIGDNITTFPWSPDLFTREQMRLWLEDADTSWAPGTFSVSEKDSSCESIVVADQEIKLGSDNMVSRREGGQCRGILTVYVLLYSGNGDIVDFYGNKGHQRFLHLVDMTTGRSAEPLPVDENSRCVQRGDLLVVYGNSGRMTAYRPA